RRLDRFETGVFDPDGSAAVRQHLRSRRRRHVALARYLPPVRTKRFQDEVAVRSIGGLADRVYGPESLVWRSREGARRFRGCRRAEIWRDRIPAGLPVPDAENSEFNDGPVRRRGA